MGQAAMGVGQVQGRRLSHFLVTGAIGAGGMGEVYRARDERLHRDVAIKVLPKELALDPERLRRLESEARALARLNHPNLLAVYELGTDDTVTFIVTELLEGETLFDLLKGGPLPWRRAVEIGAAIAAGVAAAHTAGVVHRDLKPANVFVTTDGRIKVLDFGLARLLPPPDTGATDDTALDTCTAPGTVLGTVGYMAPEQVRGEPADHRSDLFAFGCLLYEMLAGRRPFAGDTAADVMAAILKSPPRPLAGLTPEVTPELVRILDRCLEKNAAARFQSAGDLAFALRSLDRATEPARQRPAPKAAAEDDRPSIAVLPFANLSADPEQEYFCDGMAEEIINALAHLAGLRVIARTSSFVFKGERQDIREIGSTLDVGTVLEGSVRKAGDRVRITAQLIDVADGSHLWSERFDRRLEDVFAIQDEIALAVVDNLKVRLLGGDRAAIVRRFTENLDAHNAYLKGLHYWNMLSPEGYAQSREYFEEAIRIEPAFMPAYAWLVVWYFSRAFWADMPPREVAAKALPLASKALELEPSLAVIHSALGIYRAYFERDWEAGERTMLRGIELGPNEASAHANLGGLMVVRGRFDEAIEACAAAKRLDPLSPAYNCWAAQWMAISGRYEEGLQELERLLRMFPDHWLPYHDLSDLYARGSRLDEARSMGEKALELSGHASATVFQLACVCYLGGDRQRGGELFEELQKRASERYVSPSFLAWVHLARGEPAEALDRLREAARINDPWLPFHPLFSPALVPDDPRVSAFMKEIGIA